MFNRTLEYSEVERLLFTHFDVLKILDNCNVILVYTTVMMYRAFLHPEDYDPRYISALREALKLLEKGHYRMTDVFDNVIMEELSKEN